MTVAENGSSPWPLVPPSCDHIVRFPAFFQCCVEKEPWAHDGLLVLHDELLTLHGGLPVLHDGLLVLHDGLLVLHDALLVLMLHAGLDL